VPITELDLVKQAYFPRGQAFIQRPVSIFSGIAGPRVVTIAQHRPTPQGASTINQQVARNSAQQ